MTQDPARAAVRLLMALASRLVAIAVSGTVHATVFASLASRAPAKMPPAAETMLILENQEAAPEPPVVAPPVEAKPIEPVAKIQRHEATSPPKRAVATDDAPDFLARFMMTLPPGTASPGEGAAAEPAPETTYGEDDVSTPARLLSNVDAAYPTEAWSSMVEANVPIEIVVDAHGRVVSSRVVTRAGHGFDEAALASIESYRFAPARRDGRDVRVRVRWSVQFRVRR